MLNFCDLSSPNISCSICLRLDVYKVLRPTCNWPLKNKVEIQNFISLSCCFYEVPLHTQGKKVCTYF